MGTSERYIGEFQHYLKLCGRAAATIRNYGGRLRELDRFLGEETDLIRATEDHVFAWRDSLTVADASIVAYAAGVRSFYRWAVQKGHLVSSPATYLPLPRIGRRLPRPIACDDLQDAIFCAPDRVRPWLVLAGYAGLRCCEIARLKREDIYENAPLPYMIVHGKNDKERAVPMSAYVWRELQRAGLPRRRGWVFPRRDGKVGHTPRGVVCQLGNFHLRACGLVDTMHALRHRFGTIGYQKTGDLRELQEVMGHEKIDTTAGYAAHANRRAAALADAVQPDGFVTLRVVADDPAG